MLGPEFPNGLMVFADMVGACMSVVVWSLLSRQKMEEEDILSTPCLAACLAHTPGIGHVTISFLIKKRV